MCARYKDVSDICCNDCFNSLSHSMFESIINENTSEREKNLNLLLYEFRLYSRMIVINDRNQKRSKWHEKSHATGRLNFV